MARVRKPGNKRVRGTMAVPALFAEAQRLQRTGALAEAERCYRDILRAAPGHPDSLHFLGLLELQRGRLDEAEQHLRQSVDGRRTPVFCSNYGLLLEQRGRHGEAAEYFRAAVEMAPEFAEGWFNLGVALENQGDLVAAVAAYGQALTARPDYIRALSNLANAQDALGRHGEAQACFDRLLTIDPATEPAVIDLAVALQRTASEAAHERARQCLELALQKNPGSPALQQALASLLENAGRFHAAQSIYSELRQAAPGNIDISLRLAHCLMQTGALPEAERLVQSILAAAPDNGAALRQWGQILRFSGRFLEARVAYGKLLELDPLDVVALHGLSQCGTVGPDDNKLLDGLQRVAARKASALALFALGKALDDQGRFAEAAAAYRRGNDMRRRRLRYSAAAHSERIDRIISLFDAARVHALDGHGLTTAAPLFIVGAPRSGTTLVESLLAAHPQVSSGGESSALAAAARGARGSGDYPDRLATLDAATAEADGHEFMASLQARAGGGQSSRIIDKTPENFLYLGYILAILPGARIIHCRRHPVDTCLSIYFQSFDAGHAYAFDLRELASWYLDYRRLMAHWERVYSGRLLHVDYEALVEDTEAATRRMLDYADLPWDPACLQFHQRRDGVLTASHWQVRQPVYSRALGRWRNYAGHLPELVEYLSGQT